MASRSARINVPVVDGQPLVWNVTHVSILKKQHRIEGVMDGPLPDKPLQNRYVLRMSLIVLRIARSVAYR